MAKTLIIVIIPFEIDIKNNEYDNDVWQHSIETIRILQSESKENEMVHMKPIIFKDQQTFKNETQHLSHEYVIINTYIVAHGTLVTMGNDGDKQLSAESIGSMINYILAIHTQLNNIYLFSCQSAMGMLPKVWDHIIQKKSCSLFGINGFIGHVKGKKHIYVSESYGGPARWRYQQRLVIAK